jgi:putative chitinase
MIEWKPIQKNLGVDADGFFGPKSYTALLSKVCSKTIPEEVGRSFAMHLTGYGVEDNVNRLAGWIGQTAHESGLYHYTRELWGPTDDQKRYDAPGNRLGNLKGDAYNFRGAGWIQVTGRYWFDVIGHALGLDLIGNPSMANDPGIATLISLEWWKRNSANTTADSGDVKRLTRLVNGGENGLASRMALTYKAKDALS